MQHGAHKRSGTLPKDWTDHTQKSKGMSIVENQEMFKIAS